MTTAADTQLALDAIRQRRFGDAIVALQQVLSTAPGDLGARWMLVQCLEQQRRPDDALQQLRQFLAHAKHDLVAIDRIADHMRRRRYPLDAVIDAYEAYLAIEPDAAVATFNYAYNLCRAGRFEEAVRQYERALETGIDQPEEVHLNIANIFMDHLQSHDDARAHLDKALALNPDYASAYYNLGNLAEQEGDRDAARRNFERCLALDPGNESALARLADAHRFADAEDALFDRLVAAARQSRNSDLHMALGRAHEQRAEYDAAWRHFSTANALDGRSVPLYSPERAEHRFRRIIEQCDGDWLRRFAGTSREVIFICGMFRSGSTLLEQMLAAHPSFTAGGEGEFFPRLVASEFPRHPEGLAKFTPQRADEWRQRHAELTSGLFGDGSRLTDKRPDNFLHVGLIKAVLPQAKFIVTERDWRDIATSIYSVRLASSQDYATRLPDIRHYIALQARLIEHWEKLLGPDLRRVRYEDLVTDPQATVSGLLQWLGEEWDAGCLEFHHLQNAVKTASVWQVREPLHAKSIGRWKNYEQAFAAAFGTDLED